MLGRYRIVVLFVIAAWGCFPVRAQTIRSIEVDAIPDSAFDLGCTLREAVESANAQGQGELFGCQIDEAGSGDPISYRLFIPSLTYELGESSPLPRAGGPLFVQATMTLTGESPEQSVIDAAGSQRVFETIGAEGVLTLQNLQVSGGRSSDGGGAGIRNLGGTVELDNVWVRDNQAIGIPMSTAVDGGGVANLSGVLRVLNQSRIFDNGATFRGGGIYSDGEVVIDRSGVLNNRASSGGGVYLLSGSLTASQCDFFENTSDNAGGGLYATHRVRTTLLGCTLASNRAGFRGGGIYRITGDVEPDQPMEIANSTLANNIAEERGGAIDGSNLVMTFVTVANNQAGVSGGGVRGFGLGVDISKSLLANNTLLDNTPSDCDGDLRSGGFNLVGRNDGCAAPFPAGDMNQNNDLIGTQMVPLDPQLASVDGDARLLRPLPSSPARDRISAVDCVFVGHVGNPLFATGSRVLTDQLDNPRDLLCDVGAVEGQALFFDGFEAAIAPAPH